MKGKVSYRNNIKVIVKSKDSNVNFGDKIIVQGIGFHKVIPAVIFSPAEAETILEIVEMVEKATFNNFIYK